MLCHDGRPRGPLRRSARWREGTVGGAEPAFQLRPLDGAIRGWLITR